MVTNFQGMTLGEQVRGNQTNAQMNGAGYYQNRTQREIGEQKSLADFNALKQQAEDINSKITSFDDYKTTYSTLPPSLKQFFKSPDDIQTGIKQQQQLDIVKVDTNVDNLQAQKVNLEKEQQDYINSTTGTSDLKGRNATIRDYEIQINTINTQIDSLQQNKGKINEGYSYDSIIDNSIKQALYGIEKSKNYDLNQGQVALINNNISQFQKDYPNEKLVFDKNGAVIGVESGAFKQGFKLPDYEKAILNQQTLYDAYIKDISKQQSVSPLLQERAGKTPSFNFDQQPIQFIQPTIADKIADIFGTGISGITSPIIKSNVLGYETSNFLKPILNFGESSIKGLGRITVESNNPFQISPLSSQVSAYPLTSYIPFKDKVSEDILNKIATPRDVYNAYFLGGATLATASGMPEATLPLSAYLFNQGVDTAKENIKEGNIGGAIASGLMLLPLASELKVSVFNSPSVFSSGDYKSYFYSKVTNFEDLSFNKETPRTFSFGDEIEAKVNKKASEVETSSIRTDKEGRTTVSKGKYGVKLNENNEAVVFGINVNLLEETKDINKATSQAVASINKQLGDASLGKNGKNLGYEMGVGGKTGSITRDAEIMKEVKLPGVDNYLQRVTSVFEKAIPKAKETYFVIKELPSSVKNELIPEVKPRVQTIKDWMKEEVDNSKAPGTNIFGVIAGKGEEFNIPEPRLELKRGGAGKVGEVTIESEISKIGDDIDKEVKSNKVDNRYDTALKSINDILNQKKAKTSVNSLVRGNMESIDLDLKSIFKNKTPINAEITQIISKKARINVKNINSFGVVEVVTKDIKDSIKAMNKDMGGQLTFDKTELNAGKNMNADEIEAMINKQKTTKTPLSKTFAEEKPTQNLNNLERQLMDKLNPPTSANSGGFNDNIFTTEKISGEAGTLDKAMNNGVNDALKNKIIQANLKSAIKGIQIPNIEEGSIFRGGVQPRGQIWGEFNGKSSFSGKMGMKSNIGDNLEKTSLPNFKESFGNDNKLLGEINSKLNDAMGNANASKMDNALLNKMDNALKFQNPQKNDVFEDVSSKLDIFEGLKFQQALITEQTQDFKQTPFINELNDIGFGFAGGGFGFGELKNKIRKKKIKKRKGINELALFPDFTAKALGISPEVIAMKDVNKALRRMNTGFGVNRGAVVKW